jgi:hypothetical protein
MSIRAEHFQAKMMSDCNLGEQLNAQEGFETDPGPQGAGSFVAE